MATTPMMMTTTTQRFDRLVSNATCRLVDINEHLLCALCSGYLVDATTIIECLHTFCRSCIVRYLESSETCPVCDVPLHQTNPLLGIRSDTTLQTLVYKLVPGIYKDEVKRRCLVINNAHVDGKSGAIMDRLLKDICDMTTGGTIYTGDEKFSVCLQYSPSSDSTAAATSFKELCSKEPAKSNCSKLQQDLTDCSYLLCPASLTMAHLKKLLRNKLELGSDIPLELYHSSRDGNLEDTYALADVAYITAWTSVKPLHFFYRVDVRRTSEKPAQETVSMETNCTKKPTSGSKWGKPFVIGCFKQSLGTKHHNMKEKTAAKEKTSKIEVRRLKGPPGKCLSAKTVAGKIKSPALKEKSAKSGVREDLVASAAAVSCDKAVSLTEGEDVTRVSCDDRDSVILLEDDTLESYPILTKSSNSDLVELMETEADINQRTSKKISGEERPDTVAEQGKQSVTDCSNSVDSALSPSRPELVTQLALTADSSDTMSEAEGNAIDSASSPPPPKKSRKAEPLPNDRNLFAVINSMIVSSNSNNNNDNVVSSSTSSQASADDSSDNKTSVETQTSAKLISRRMKKSKLRVKRDSLKTRFVKQNTPAEETNAEDVVLPGGVTLSAPTSSQSISVAAHAYSTAATTPCQSTTLCVPICIGDKGSNLILNLPQNVSVQCRIRSDKILIASSPTTTTSDVVSTFSSISYSETTTIGATDSQNISSFPGPPTDGDGAPLPRQPKTRTLASDCTGSTCCGDSTSSGDNQPTQADKDKDKGSSSRSDSHPVARDDCGNRNTRVDSANPTSCASHTTVPTLSTDGQITSDCERSLFPVRNGSLSWSPEVVRTEADGAAPAQNSVHSSHANSASKTNPETISGTSVCGNSPQSSIAADQQQHLQDLRVQDEEPQSITTSCQDNNCQLNSASAESCQTVSKENQVQQILSGMPITSSSTTPDTRSVPAITTTTTSTAAPKVVLFKPYQMTTTSQAVVTTCTTQNAPTTGIYSPRAYPVFPNFTYTMNQSGCLLRDISSVVCSGDDSKADKAMVSMSAIHCTANNIPLRNVIKVPIYTASCRQTPPSRKSDKKSGSRTVQGSSAERGLAGTPMTGKNLLELKTTKTEDVVRVDSASAVNHATKEDTACKGTSCNEANKDTKEELKALTHEGWKTSLRASLKLPLTTGRHKTDKDGESSCATSTSGSERSSSHTGDGEASRKASSLTQPCEFPEESAGGGQSENRSYSPKRRSEKASPLDEMTYTRAEADSGTSPGAMSLLPPRSGSLKVVEVKKDEPTSLQKSPTSTPVRKKLVIDLERCSSRPEYVSRLSEQTTSIEQRLRCCSPTTTLQLTEPHRTRQTPPAKLVISLPRCPIPQPVNPIGTDTVQSSAAGHGCLPPWSSASSSVDNTSPPTTKRLKLMCNGMTIYRTLESPGARSRRMSGGGSRKSSPVSAPALECPLSRPSVLASPVSSKSTSQGKCRRRSSGGGAAAMIVGGEPSIIVSVDSTSASPRSAASAPSSSNNNSLFTASPWKGLERSISLPDPDSNEGPLELTTKEVKERQKEREYEKFMSSRLPPSAFTT